MATVQRITPFLWFEDKAEEAMEFYTSIFPDSRIVSIKRYPEGITEGPMAGFDGKVLTGVFELMGQRFMALDGGPVFQPSGAVSFLVECKDQAEIDTFWDALSADPASEQCGWLKDKYGFSWQIVPDMSQWLGDESEGAQRATQAMLGMKKIIIADLQKAYDGK
ncbi:VOC family protein [Candidatus Berkelbacteria bacterium]|nr:VOC family protein [Candidatus Berkelbacteria bacterium]